MRPLTLNIYLICLSSLRMHAGLPGGELSEMLHHAAWAREKVHTATI